MLAAEKEGLTAWGYACFKNIELESVLAWSHHHLPGHWPPMGKNSAGEQFQWWNDQLAGRRFGACSQVPLREHAQIHNILLKLGSCRPLAANERALPAAEPLGQDSAKNTTPPTCGANRPSERGSELSSERLGFTTACTLTCHMGPNVC